MFFRYVTVFFASKIVVYRSAGERQPLRTWFPVFPERQLNLKKLIMKRGSYIPPTWLPEAVSPATGRSYEKQTPYQKATALD